MTVQQNFGAIREKAPGTFYEDFLKVVYQGLCSRTAPDILDKKMRMHSVMRKIETFTGQKYIWRKRSMKMYENGKYERLSRRALYCMYTVSVIAAAVGIALIVAVNRFWFFPKGVTVGKWISAALLVLILADTLVSPFFRYCRYRYRISEECIDIVEGYLFVKRHIVPMERLHKLQTKKGPIDQMFGVAKVVVTTGGGDVTLSFLEEEKAEQIADSLRKRINEIVEEQRAK